MELRVAKNNIFINSCQFLSRFATIVAYGGIAYEIHLC